MAKLSLADLDRMANEPTPPPAPPSPPAPPVPPTPPVNDPPPPPPIKSGNGEPTPADLEKERQRQQQQQKTPEEIIAENRSKGLNDDGSEKTQAQKDQEAAAAADEEDDMAVWKAVDKIWGSDLELEYKDAAGQDIHPNSPEGIFLREQAVGYRAVQSFEADLEKTDPRGYAYLLHRRAGGTDEDFFANKTVTLPTYEEFQNSVDLKVRVYRESLLAKGMEADDVKELVDKAVANKTIDTKADTAYRSMERDQKAEIERLAKANEQQELQTRRAIQALDKSLAEEMSSGMRIIIPDNQKDEFNKFVRSHVAIDGGQFFFSQPIDAKGLPQLLDMMYFYFKKGNMGELVQRETKSANVVRLRAAVNRSTQTAPAAADGGGKKKLTLGEI